MAKKPNKQGSREPGAWRIDGISPQAVAAAEQAAAEAGLALNVWLSRLIRDSAQRERGERETRVESAGHE